MKAVAIGVWGDDLTVVNNARVSFDKESDYDFTGNFFDLKTEDKRLIQYLARGCTGKAFDDMILELQATGESERIIEILKDWRATPTHWAPFANGVGAQFHIKVPIPIMRHIFKTKVGSVESEVSRRYVSYKPEVFYPDWRQAAENVKQGSGGSFGPAEQDHINLHYQNAVQIALNTYDELLAAGVCPEQARFVLPQAAYTEARISNSLYGWANFYRQRSDVRHAQREVAEIAEQIGSELEACFPISWKALTK